KPFDLSQPPLLRTAFVNVKSSQPELYFVMHHIITDGTSWDILMNEFYGLYRGEKPPHLKLQYKDYAGWEKTRQQQETLKQQESFWLNTLSGKLPVLHLPTDYERPAVQSFAGNTINFILNREETQCLLGIAKRADVTLYMTMLAIFNVLLSKLSGQEDIIVGTPVAGRQHADLMNIIGNFVNMLAIRNFVPGNKTFRTFLEEIKKRTLDAFSNQDYQFGNLVEKLLDKRDPSRNPIFDVVFNMLGQSDAQEDDKDDSSAPGERQVYDAYEYKRKTSQFDINCAALQKGNRVYFSIEYCTSLFKKSTIERFFEYFKNILLALSASLDVKLSEIRMITKEEQQELFTITPMARGETVK
ncbi:condensation domain-containing protein, partial [Acidobacteriota bacterium]